MGNGCQALHLNTTGSYNTASGSAALRYNTTGDSNTATGYESLFLNTTGNLNLANGYRALYSNRTGYYNIANGARALFSNTGGNYNTANGLEALYYVLADGNTANGFQALAYTTTGSYNTAEGFRGLFSNTTGNYNIGIGYNAGDNITTGSSNIIIGSGVDAQDGTLSNQLNIGNTIYGDLTNDYVGIGVSDPDATLEINGQIKITGGVPVNGYVLTTDVNGLATWEAAPTADNLGNHTATQTINTANNWISGDGDGEGISIDNSGNVGVGTITPSETFGVLGNISTTGIYKVDNLTTHRDFFILRSDDGTNNNNRVAWMQYYRDDADTYHWNFWGSNEGSATQSVIMTLGYDNGTGNVGIGVTDPDATLEINGQIKITGGVPVNGYVLTTDVNGLATWEAAPAADNLGNHTATQTINTANNWISGDGDGEGISIDNSGNVGVGTSSPVTSFSVVNNNESTVLTDFTQALTKAGIQIETEYTDSNYTPGLFWSTSNENSTKPKAGIWLYEDGSGTDMYFGTSNSYATGITNNGLVLDQSGNVGVGTSSPGAKLEIEYSSGRGLLIDGLSGGEACIDLKSGTNTTYISNSGWGMADGVLGIGDGISPTIVIDTGNSRVGIGTTSPGEKLDINGAMHLTPGSTPTIANEGDIYMDSTSHKLRCYDGTSWHDLW